MTQLSPEQVKQGLEQQKLTILDVREPWEFAICNLGGKHVPMHEIPVMKAFWNSGDTICVVCKTGKRAEAAANLLNHLYPEIEFVILDGGITAWYASFEPAFEMY